MVEGDLFHEDIYEAISATVELLGGYKKVAGWLFPNKPLNTAYAHLKNCVRSDKSEKLDPHELLQIMVKGGNANVHYIANFMAEQANYLPPVPCKPVDEVARLQREYIEHAKLMVKISAKIERAQQS